MLPLSSQACLHVSIKKFSFKRVAEAGLVPCAEEMSSTQHGAAGTGSEARQSTGPAARIAD